MARKNKKRKKAIISLLFSFFMLTSLASVVLYYGDDTSSGFRESTDDGTYVFTRRQDQTGNLYYEASGPDEFVVFLRPEQVFLDIDEQSKTILSQANFYYMTFDPTRKELAYVDQLRLEFQNNVPASTYIQDAVSQPHQDYALPAITCQNASANTPVIMLEQANTTKVSASGTCIQMTFAPQDILYVRDAFIYLTHNIAIG